MNDYYVILLTLVSLAGMLIFCEPKGWGDSGVEENPKLRAHFKGLSQDFRDSSAVVCFFAEVFCI